ncbi:MAG: PfkB family carbohydrate kinase [Candidatus Omnitrophica bacterium]|nr:PfkB family carbohydrate kinase [Candidatus Omnitrophota bacterium]
MSLIVLGTLALDTVKTPFGKRTEMLGGSAVHFSMSARLFTGVNLVAVVGKDFPARHIDFLRRKKVVTSSVIVAEGKTFRWEGEYRGDLNSALTLNTRLGVLSAFNPVVASHQRKIKNVFLANIDPDLQQRLLTYLHAPRLIGVDSMNFWIEHKRASLLKLLKKAHIYVANDQEARSLTGEHNLIKAARGLSAFGPAMVLIKKGEHGVLFYAQKLIFSLPAYPTDKVIDPTGAGDTFAGGLMGYLASTKKLDEAALKRAILYGTVAASFNVEAFGLERTARLSRADLDRRLARFRRCVSFWKS